MSGTTLYLLGKTLWFAAIFAVEFCPLNAEHRLDITNTMMSLPEVTSSRRRRPHPSLECPPNLPPATDKPNTDGAGTTGGIIGGLIAAIVALAVVATGILLCRQQQKQRMEEEDLEGPPAYKPPPPGPMAEEKELVPNPPEADSIPLKTPYFESSATDDPFGGVITTSRMEDAPQYHELPTMEEREAVGHTAPSPEDSYLDQVNPIYDALSFAATEEEAAVAALATDKAFIMSRAMYV